MTLKVEQKHEDHGIYRRLSGSCRASDFEMLFSAQNAMVNGDVRYIIVDLLGIEESDDDWPQVFAFIQRRASSYVRGMLIVFVADRESERTKTQEYFQHMGDTGWSFHLAETVDEARDYVSAYLASEIPDLSMPGGAAPVRG